MNAHSSIIAMATAEQATAPLAWEQAYETYQAARKSGVEYSESGAYIDEIGGPLGLTRYEALKTLLATPAPSLDALAIKLAIFAGDDGHEYEAAGVMQAHIMADALRLAHESSASPEITRIAVAQHEKAVESLSYYFDDAERAKRMEIQAISARVVEQITGKPVAIERSPVSWNDAVAALDAITVEEQAFEARVKAGENPADHETDALATKLAVRYRNVFAFPAPTIKEVGSKLQLFVDHQLCERADAATFIEPIIEDIERLAPSTGPDVDPELIAACTEVLQLRASEPEPSRQDTEAAEWEWRIGKVEEVLRDNVSTSAPVLIAQLWVAVDHMVDRAKPSWLRDAISQNDFGTIMARREDLDFDVRMVVQAIDGLMAMEAVAVEAGQSAEREVAHA
ncbi:hypothetical protein ACFSTI_29420 [Rhizorhabdus histidinilytica]|uniref:Uncharacterized protein n=1 Tax=Rhizorhabdus histidinilytica TaxID=439228 RepID=A0A1T5CHT8_9SPHN|nr:hypothetical protein [Rhizorhabdus histidinilytica]SKB59019.1 hypothetical protein SAMN06295920_10474 [Rhizorhabdus histidinilytica]